VRLDKSSAYARELIAAGPNPFTPLGIIDYQITAGTGFSLPTKGVRLGQKVALFDGTQVAQALACKGRGESITLLCEFMLSTTTPADQGILSIGNSFSTDGAAIRIAGNNTLAVDGATGHNSSALLSANVRYVAAFSMKQMNTVPLVYLDGKDVTGTGTVQNAPPVAQLVIGAQLDTNPLIPMQGWIGVWAFWNRALDAQELRELTLNPYQLFVMSADPKRTRRNFSVNPTGTLAATLADATASFTGSEIFSGTLSSTLAGATMSIGVNALAGATMSMTGQLIYSGTFAPPALAGATMSMTGKETFSGTLVAVLSGATMSMTSSTTQPITGTFSSTLEGARMEALGGTTTPLVFLLRCFIRRRRY
jgi:hypothetical protein